MSKPEISVINYNIYIEEMNMDVKPKDSNPRIKSQAENDYGDVLSASRKGADGDSEKNAAIIKMVADYKKLNPHATDEECEALTRALQSSGTSGEIQGNNLTIVQVAMSKMTPADIQ